MLRTGIAIIVGLSLVGATSIALAGATRVPGGGDADTDCFAEYEALGDVTFFPDDPATLVCTDCDPTCDKDGVASPNGSCTFELSLCLGQDNPSCTTPPLRKVRARRKSLNTPALDSTECSDFASTETPSRRADASSESWRPLAGSSTSTPRP